MLVIHEHTAHLHGVWLCHVNVKLEVILMRKVCGAFGQGEVLGIGVLGLQVEMEIAINADMQGVHISIAWNVLSIAARSRTSALMHIPGRDPPSLAACCVLAGGTQDSRQ